MDDIIFYDFSQDGFLDGQTDMFLIDGTWAHHHDELDFRSCEGARCLPDQEWQL